MMGGSIRQMPGNFKNNCTVSIDLDKIHRSYAVTHHKVIFAYGITLEEKIKMPMMKIFVSLSRGGRVKYPTVTHC